MIPSPTEDSLTFATGLRSFGPFDFTKLSHVTVVTFIYVIIFLQTQEEVCLGKD